MVNGTDAASLLTAQIARRPICTPHRFARATAGLDGPERLRVFQSLAPEAQAAFWARLGSQVEGRRLLEWDVLRDGPPPGRARPQHRHSGRRSAATRLAAGDDPLRLIAPPIYIELLAGLTVPRSGFVCCPMPDHEDLEASCRVYEEPERGFYCWGCGGGGSIYDLRAGLSGIGTRGVDFQRLRAWIAGRMLARTPGA